MDIGNILAVIGCSMKFQELEETKPCSKNSSINLIHCIRSQVCNIMIITAGQRDQILAIQMPPCNVILEMHCWRHWDAFLNGKEISWKPQLKECSITQVISSSCELIPFRQALREKSGVICEWFTVSTSIYGKKCINKFCSEVVLNAREEYFFEPFVQLRNLN